MAVSLAELAKLVGGHVLGDGGSMITGAATLNAARPGEITLVDSTDKLPRLAHSAATAVVVPVGMAPGVLPAMQVDNVHAAFARIVGHFRPQKPAVRVGISPQAYVSPSAQLAEDVDVHPGATVGDDVKIGAGSTIHTGAPILAGCAIGEQVTIFPNAVLYENTVVGPRSVIHAGAVLGAHGFGYSLVDGRHKLSAQLGYVEIGADVEVGACTTIDRGTYGPTLIGDGAKLDNQVMIAHNCRIGRHNLICSQAGVAGSTTTGDYVVMAGQVGVCDHVHIGDRSVIGAKSGISNNVPADVQMLGVPARPLREQRLLFAAITKLPEMRIQLKALKAAVADLQRNASSGEQESGGTDQGGRNAAA